MRIWDSSWFLACVCLSHLALYPAVLHVVFGSLQQEMTANEEWILGAPLVKNSSAAIGRDSGWRFVHHCSKSSRFAGQNRTSETYSFPPMIMKVLH